jgi:hypothetical protein
MNKNNKIKALIKFGIPSNVVTTLSENRINSLYRKMINEIQQQTTTTYKATDDEVKKGVKLNLPAGSKGVSMRKDPTGSYKITPESEFNEDYEMDVMNFDRGGRTQKPRQVGPSSNDGFDNYDDGTGEFNEGKKSEKKNPWAICHAQLGPKKTAKFERCVTSVKKSLKEGKNPLSLFLENEITRIVKNNLPPKMTKSEIIKYLYEAETAEPLTKPAPKTKPSTPDTKPVRRERPAHPGKNPNPGVQPAPKARKKHDFDDFWDDLFEAETAEPLTKPAPKIKPSTPDTKPVRRERPAHPGKNPNPGVQPAPKARNISPERAKDEIIKTIFKNIK